MRTIKIKKIYFSLIAVFGINIISKVIGFLRETLMAAFFGTTEVTDAFLMSSSTVNILFSILTAVSILYIPLLAEHKEREGEEKEKLTAQFLQLLFIIAIIIGGVLFLFKDQILFIVANGFDEYTYRLTKKFLFFSSLGFLLSIINQILIYNLNYYSVFLRAGLTNIVLSAAQIVCIILSNYTDNLLYLNVAQTVGCILQMIILTKIIFFLKIKIHFCIIQWGLARKIVGLSIPIILSTVIDDLNVMVDKAFASNLGIGIISSMNYAHILKQLLFFIIVNSSISVIYPKISSIIAKNCTENLGRLFQLLLWGAEILIIPITLGSIAYSKDIVRIVYERGAFDRQSTMVTSQIFSMYVLALLPLAYRELLQRILYSYQDTKETFKINAAMSVSNIVLNILLFPFLKYRGLALATAISAYLALPLYFKCMKKKEIRINVSFLLKEAAFILIISFFSIVPLFNIYRRISRPSICVILSFITGSIVIYFMILFIGRKKEFYRISRKK